MSNRQRINFRWNNAYLVVQRIDAGCLHPDQDFSWVAFWHRHLHILQDAWRTEVLIRNCMLSTLHTFKLHLVPLRRQSARCWLNRAVKYAQQYQSGVELKGTGLPRSRLQGF